MSETQAPPPRRSGLPWGCLTPIIVIGVLIVAGIGYVSYYMNNGYRNDPSVQTVFATAQSNGIARAVMGGPITLVGTPAYSWNYDNGVHTATYTLSVHGSRGDGTVQATVLIVGKQTQIKTMSLTGPDGKNYDLFGSPTGSTTSAALDRRGFATHAFA